MHLNLMYISSLTCLLLSFKISLPLNVCLIVILIMIFYVLLGVLVFRFCVRIMFISWIFHSSPCVFLGYSSSHLGYRCLDFASQRICLPSCLFSWKYVSFCRFWIASSTPNHSLTTHTLAHLDHLPQLSPAWPTKCLTQQLCHTYSLTQTAPPFHTPICHHTTAT